MLTVDVPVQFEARTQHAQRVRQYPRQLDDGALSLKPSLLAEAMTHPGWIAEYIRHGGTPALENWLPYARPGATRGRTPFSSTAPGAGACADLEGPRKIPPPVPARPRGQGHHAPGRRNPRADIGCDGVIVSNHGARQLDQAPASLDVLPAVKAAVGDRMTVMLDSGVRRGADILIAMCLGAQFVFFGRPTLYGAVAGGLPGSRKRSTSSAPRSTW